MVALHNRRRRSMKTTSTEEGSSRTAAAGQKQPRRSRYHSTITRRRIGMKNEKQFSHARAFPDSTGAFWSRAANDTSHIAGNSRLLSLDAQHSSTGDSSLTLPLQCRLPNPTPTCSIVCITSARLALPLHWAGAYARCPWRSNRR